MDSVKDNYVLDEDLLHTKADNSSYWKTCCSFWDQVKNKKINDLTGKQVDWLDRISEELEDA